MMTPAMRAHTKLRLAERYGLTVSSADLFQLAKQLAHGQGELLARQSKQVALWRLAHQGQAIRFVFDSASRSILTALPPEDSAGYLAARTGRQAAPTPVQHRPTA